MKTIGFLGLGSLGSRMTERLLNAGYTLVIWDKDRKAREAFRGRVALADSLRDLVQRADQIFVMLKDTSAVLDASLSAQGIYDNLRPGKIVVSTTTIAPSTSLQLAEKFRRKRAYFLEAPVLGSPSMASQGELITLVGGDRGAYQEILDVLKTFSSRVFYIGGNGTALTLKLALMHVVAAQAEALGETAALLEKNGIDVRFLAQILRSIQDNVFSVERSAEAIADRSYEVHYGLDEMLEDLRLAANVARETKVSTPVLSLLESIYTAASTQGYGNADYSAIAELLRDLNKKKKE